ncbi:MAG: AP endonuclease [Marivirga sp.]|nr:AP endonuclease [Marivirga sp.]
MRASEKSRIFYIYVLLTACVLTLMSFNSMQAQKASKDQNLFNQENLVAWCIVPFDNQNRNPQQRIEMLKRLNFSQYAYDWRHLHLASFPEELRLAKQSKIKITAVWMWIDKGADTPGKLSEDNETLLSMLKDAGLKTQLWVGFNNNFYEYDNEETKVIKGVEMLKYLRERTQGLVSGIGLYNHGDWFGEPENQIKILEKLNSKSIGLIYNFHHGHGQIESFPMLLIKMIPWLWTVNINGMKKNGPQILTVGDGDEELEMLRALQRSGFKGTIGILGHIETEDVEKVLQRNLTGLRKLEQQLKP